MRYTNLRLTYLLTLPLRLDGCSTACQWSQGCDTLIAADPPAAVTLIYLFIYLGLSEAAPHTGGSTIVRGRTAVE